MELSSKLPDHSRVWVFQSKESLQAHESHINEVLTEFINNWDSHGTPVKGAFKMVQSHFIVIAADESAAQVSGCSIDSVVSVIKELSTQLNMDLFDRQTIFFLANDSIHSLSISDFGKAIEEGVIGEDTLMVNTLVTNLKEFNSKWLCPLKSSWHKNLAI